MNTITTKIVAAAVAIAATSAIMAGIAGLTINAENQASGASTQYVASASKTTVVVTRQA
jgi:hypothetical protein